MNAQMTELRQAALDLLQPNKKDLEHGLELHRDSLVIEAYGFPVHGLPNTDALKKAVSEGATAEEIEDMDASMRAASVALDPDMAAEHREAWEASGVTCILAIAGGLESHLPARLMKRLAFLTYACDLMRDYCPRAACPDDIVAAKKAGRRCYYFNSNAVPLACETKDVATELAPIRDFFQMGIRQMHLTYNRSNVIGGGCGERRDGGLTDFGRAVVAEMNRVGVIVDVAHCGMQTSLDAALASNKPMVASHATAYTLNAHYRAKTDEVIRAIADTDGYVGLCGVPIFTGGKGDITAFLDHIEYVVKHFGADRAAIATDTEYWPAARPGSTPYPPWPQRRTPWYSLWPPPGSGWDNPSVHWINFPMLTVGMVQRGMKDDDIRKVLGGNVLRVCRAVWDRREPLC